jgi:hypothetical protein
MASCIVAETANRVPPTISNLATIDAFFTLSSTLISSDLVK